MSIRRRWRPVRVEGDDAKGSLTFADGDGRPRLAVRWVTPGTTPFRRPKPAGAICSTLMHAEVGRLAADEATRFDPPGDWAATLFYEEPTPPGRDVFVGVSNVSGRVVQVVRPARRRDPVLKNVILPALADAAPGESRRWAIFDLDVEVPPGYGLLTHRLAAGDLQLTLAKRDGRRTLPLVVRQVRPASLALSRLPVERWLKSFADESLRFHKRDGSPTQMDDIGLVQTMCRRRRYHWLSSVPPTLLAAAVHDESADRLLLLRAADAATLRSVAASTLSHPRLVPALNRG